MKAARPLALLLALLLLAGCAAQQSPAPPEESDEPEQTPDLYIEATACPHPSWANGRCTSCGIRCPHERHDLETKRCLSCGEVVPHSFLMGFCTRCGVEPSFEYNCVPRELFDPCAHAGTVEMLTYSTTDYRASPRDKDPPRIEKQMAVYLPYGYDPSERYDVLILLHGIGGTPDYWLVDSQDYAYPSGDDVYTAQLLDNMIDRVCCRPMIVAAPTFYRNSRNPNDYSYFPDRDLFARELKEAILPALIEHYSTYAADGARESITRAREHFAFAGLSQGSIYVYTAILPDCLDCFAWFGCFSGSDGNMVLLARKLNAQRDWPIYLFYNGIGTRDPFLGIQRNQYRELVGYARPLTDGENAYFHEYTGLAHVYAAWSLGLYNFLPLLFANSP
ncbi:MAG: alpha/beta hydrolase [Clostridia bacterium]